MSLTSPISTVYLIIERIEDAGPDRRARRLVFSDSTERLTSKYVTRDLDLHDGERVDATQLKEQLAALEQQHAKERALRLVGYRERTCAELSRRLGDDGFPREVVDPLVERFADIGLVDDERFARQYVRSRLLSGYGVRRIRGELARRGVDDQTAEQALQDSDAADELTRAGLVAHGRPVSTTKERERLVRRLVARGFDFRTAVGVVKSLGPESET